MEALKPPVPQKINFVPYAFRYSICTLVTNQNEYQEMLHSFMLAGFTNLLCEFLYIDNTSHNTYDSYLGINEFLQRAQGELIIVCHQDVLINIHRIENLENRISEIDALDKNWAILSNAGGIEDNLYQRVAARMTYPDGFFQSVGQAPQKVCSVDENFILIKKSANLTLSSNLSGFHLYGLDICLIAELLGFSAYVIDFRLTHKSYGNPDEIYYHILNNLKSKYLNFFRSRHIITTITDFELSTSPTRRWGYKLKWIRKIVRKVHKTRHKKLNRQNNII